MALLSALLASGVPGWALLPLVGLPSIVCVLVSVRWGCSLYGLLQICCARRFSLVAYLVVGDLLQELC